MANTPTQVLGTKGETTSESYGEHANASVGHQGGDERLEERARYLRPSKGRVRVRVQVGASWPASSVHRRDLNVAAIGCE